jgi:hypothetical protein
MAEMPETRYVKNGDVHLAYQVMGNGPFDVVPAFSSIDDRGIYGILKEV